MNAQIQILRKVPIFSSLVDQDIEKLASIIREKAYRKKDVIFHQGDQSNILFILKSGLVKVSLIEKNYREAILKMIYENEFFGEMSLLDRAFRSATVTAMEESKAILIFPDDFILNL